MIARAPDCTYLCHVTVVILLDGAFIKLGQPRPSLDVLRQVADKVSYWVILVRVQDDVAYLEVELSPVPSPLLREATVGRRRLLALNPHADG